MVFKSRSDLSCGLITSRGVRVESNNDALPLVLLCQKINALYQLLVTLMHAIKVPMVITEFLKAGRLFKSRKTRIG
jgi:hypothetical protein